MKRTNDFRVSFILRCTTSITSNATILARIAVDRKRSEFSINQTRNPAFWDAYNQEARGNRELMKGINPHLIQVKGKIIACYNDLKSQNAPITAQTIKNLVIGEKQVYDTLLSLMLYHKTTGESILKKGTLKNYGATEKYVRKFIVQRFKVNDIPLSHLNFEFITQFELFLRTTTPLEECPEIFESMEIKRPWFAWTENPADPEGRAEDLQKSGKRCGWLLPMRLR